MLTDSYLSMVLVPQTPVPAAGTLSSDIMANAQRNGCQKHSDTAQEYSMIDHSETDDKA